MQFASIYRIVPVPSIFFIGKAGTALDVATKVLSSVEKLELKIAKVLQLAGKAKDTSSTAAAVNDFIREEAKASGSKQEEVKNEVERKNQEEKLEEKTEVEQKNQEEEVAEKKDEHQKEPEKKEEEEIVCKDGVCFKKPKETNKEEVKLSEETKAPTPPQEEEDKLAETRKYLEQKRRERIEEEKRLEKERELRRRKEGKEMQNLRAWQKDQELKELKENIKRERLEEQVARERIRAQIAADKLERAQKFATDTQAATTSGHVDNSVNTAKSAVNPSIASDESRLQFRMASGASNSHNFKSSTTLLEIRDYVVRELLPGTGIKEFTLATTYPKRELTNEHNTKTLLELELFPSAVILIIGKEATGPTAIISRNGGILNMLAIMIMTILNPIFSIFNTAKNWFTGKGKENKGNNAQTGAQKRANENQNEALKHPKLDRFSSAGGSGQTTGSANPDDASPSSSTQAGAYRRYVGGSNIHRLSDNRKDSDDENATWNGNSTQQQ
ncbi:uncharacterized protein ACRADG_002668 isoform 2-T2 [Cochliomyia hominivorax]